MFAPQDTVLECHYAERVAGIPLYEKK